MPTGRFAVLKTVRQTWRRLSGAVGAAASPGVVEAVIVRPSGL
jgi:hypothetical protein